MGGAQTWAGLSHRRGWTGGGPAINGCLDRTLVLGHTGTGGPGGHKRWRALVSFTSLVLAGALENSV